MPTVEITVTTFTEILEDVAQFFPYGTWVTCDEKRDMFGMVLGTDAHIFPSDTEPTALVYVQWPDENDYTEHDARYVQPVYI